MELYVVLVAAALVVASANLFFGLIRTYYAKYAKKTYVGSVEYWTSWQKRKYDVAAQVLREIGLDSQADIEKLGKLLEKSKTKKVKIWKKNQVKKKKKK